MGRVRLTTMRAWIGGVADWKSGRAISQTTQRPVDSLTGGHSALDSDIADAYTLLTSP